MSKLIDVFVSSPQDVSVERQLAAGVFARLNQEYVGQVELRPFFWEDGVLMMDSDPQSQTPLTSGYSVVVCILWSRLGSMLNPESFLRPGSSEPYPSGTAFELETAMRHRETTKGDVPAIYLFRCTGKRVTEVGSSEYDKLGADYKLLEDYYRDLIGREYLKRSSNEYEMPLDFERKLYQTLREVLRKALEADANQVQQKTGGVRINPFKELRSFNYQDAAYFHGRQRAIMEVIRALDQQAKASRPFMMIFGSSGLGKSSLVKAGVLPWLRKPGFIAHVRFWRHVILTPSRNPDPDIFQVLAEALLRPGEAVAEKDRLNTPASLVGQSQVESLVELTEEFDSEGNRIDANRLALLLREHPGQAAAAIVRCLDKICLRIKQKERSHSTILGRVVVVVDQFEEIFANEKRDKFLQALTFLMETGVVWVIGTTRSDYFAECEKWELLNQLKQGAGTYHLAEASIAELTEMILRPAEAVGLRFEHDGDRRLEMELINAAHGNPHALPLLEFTLSQLYERTPIEENVISLRAYDELRGVEGALALYAVRSFEEVFPPQKPEVHIHEEGTSKVRMQAALEKYGEEAMHCFGAVMRCLVLIGTGEGEKPVRDTPTKELLYNDAAKARLTERLIENRLLYVSNGRKAGVATVTVAHEALLSCWPMLKDWIKEHRSDLKFRDHLKLDAYAWDSDARRTDYLYGDEARLSRSRQLLAMDFLDDRVAQEFVRESIEVAEVEKLQEYLSSASEGSIFQDARLIGVKSRKTALERALADKRRAVRQNAAIYLRHDPELAATAEKLVDLVISDSEQIVRRAAAESLVALNREQLFSAMLRRLESDSIRRRFRVIGGIARTQIAAERAEGEVNLSSLIKALPRWERFRVAVRIRIGRFVTALPIFVLILIGQLAFCSVAAGLIKMALGVGSYSIVQADQSWGAGLFGGVTAALFWGSSITMGIAFHRFVFSRRRDRPRPSSPVPTRALFLPLWSLVAGGVCGLMGSFMIVALIASVFSSDALYSMGWQNSAYTKSLSGYATNLWHEMFWVTGYGWPHLITGTCLGIGMAMTANGLLASQKWWEECQNGEKQLVDFRTFGRLFWVTCRHTARRCWPIFLILGLGWGMAFGVLRAYWQSPPVEMPPITQNYQGWQCLGMELDASPEDLKILEKEIRRREKEKEGKSIHLKSDFKRLAVAEALKRDLRFWKLSAWGQGIGLAGDVIAQMVGGFFCVVGLGMGVIASARGFYIEPSRD